MEEQNPWWFGETHPAYQEWENYSVKWIPEIIKCYYSEPFALNFIVGPRQVGKTLSILIFIHRILLRRVNPKAIFYYACDEISDYKELGEILDSYLKARESWNIRNSYIFLDEITYVDEWWRAIKSRIDQKKFAKDIIYISGSTSIEILKAKERFPGRRGNGRDIIYFPMSFSEFTKNFSKIEIETTTIENTDEWEKKIATMKIFRKPLLSLLEIYIQTGGFPLPIRDFYEKGNVSITTEKTYLDWIKNEWIRMKRNEKYMKEIISYILRARLSPISWFKIAQNTSINSPNTVLSYIETLENMYIVKVLYAYMHDGKIAYRKNKKIHIIDPFLYKILSRYTRVRIDEDQIIESTVVGHIMRVGEVYYWKNRTEIDIVAIINNKKLYIEVKWSEKPKKIPPRPRPYILDKHKIPMFLSTIDWGKSSWVA